MTTVSTDESSDDEPKRKGVKEFIDADLYSAVPTDGPSEKEPKPALLKPWVVNLDEVKLLIWTTPLALFERFSHNRLLSNIGS